MKMSSNMITMYVWKKNVPYSNVPLLYTSSCFLSMGLFTLYKQRIFPGLGMILVWMTSIWYHGTNYKQAKQLDMYSNYTLGFLFTSYAVYHQHYAILGWSLLTVLGHFIAKKYKKNYIHALCVHLPGLCGLYQYAHL